MGITDNAIKILLHGWLFIFLWKSNFRHLHFSWVTQNISKRSCFSFYHRSQKVKMYFKFSFSFCNQACVFLTSFGKPTGTLSNSHWFALNRLLTTYPCGSSHFNSELPRFSNWVTFCNKILFMYSDAVSISIFLMSAISNVRLVKFLRLSKRQALSLPEFIWLSERQVTQLQWYISFTWRDRSHSRFPYH